MLRLIIRAPEEYCLRADALTEVHAWRDLSGAVSAYGYVARGERWIHFPGHVAFRFEAPTAGPAVGSGAESGTRPAIVIADRVEAFPERHVDDSTIIDLFRRSVQPLVLQAFGRETLHASAVRMPAGVVAFCGERESGKSTIAYALSGRYPQVADDTLVLEANATNVRVLMLPYGVRLRAEARAFFNSPTASPSTGGDEPDTALLAALFVLRRVGTGDSVAERLEPAAAFTAILAHAHCFDPTDVNARRRTLERYLELADAVPVYDLRFKPGLERLDGVLSCIERAAGSTHPAPPAYAATQ